MLARVSAHRHYRYAPVVTMRIGADGWRRNSGKIGAAVSATLGRLDMPACGPKSLRNCGCFAQKASTPVRALATPAFAGNFVLCKNVLITMVKPSNDALLHR